jgi:hypothetical protein
MPNLMLVHVACTDRTDAGYTVSLAQAKDYEYVAAVADFADGAQARFWGCGMGIFEGCELAAKDGLDLMAGQAVLAALRPIAGIPVKAADLHGASSPR